MFILIKKIFHCHKYNKFVEFIRLRCTTTQNSKYEGVIIGQVMKCKCGKTINEIVNSKDFSEHIPNDMTGIYKFKQSYLFPKLIKDREEFINKYGHIQIN